MEPWPAPLRCQGGNTLAQPPASPAKPDAVTAIDILLRAGRHDAPARGRPPTTVCARSFRKALRWTLPTVPTSRLVQRFVRTENLDKVYAAVGKVFASANVTGLKLEAFKYYYIPDKDLGLSGIVIKPTPELLKLEQQVIDAVTPFAVKTGTSAAFVTTPEDPDVIPPLIEYVSEVRSEAFRRAFPSARHAPASPLGNTSTKCSRNRLSRSPSRRRARPFTISATSARRRRNSKSSN